MSSDDRTMTIDVTITEGYNTVASTKVRVPAFADATWVGRLVERKVADLQSTVADVIEMRPPKPEDETTVNT